VACRANKVKDPSTHLGVGNAEGPAEESLAQAYARASAVQHTKLPAYCLRAKEKPPGFAEAGRLAPEIYSLCQITARPAREARRSDTQPPPGGWPLTRDRESRTGAEVLTP
jgi:hypothetical protein